MRLTRRAKYRLAYFATVAAVGFPLAYAVPFDGDWWYPASGVIASWVSLAIWSRWMYPAS